ncbi:hypothetical protein [Pseudoflavonifractor sp. MSJ-37]|uniref:hypothetical protein n=1 Tax=Pseudoflavonifractor sp. MSJ-37 TaxID=2841531 RepID=UPI001C10176D|nr:hypothetical protein [Pseudoflavonifractor sp. MSJ-37]MBU5436223.1 hypothetical protein [Pseudoflavonifractor sp. MSJ-37]
MQAVQRGLILPGALLLLAALLCIPSYLEEREAAAPETPHPTMELALRLEDRPMAE